MAGNEQLDFLNPIARGSDPASSHEAARKLTSRASHAATVLKILKGIGKPLTSHEIGANWPVVDMDSVKVTRRLNDLVKHDPPLVAKAPIRPCRVTGRKILTWRAV